MPELQHHQTSAEKWYEHKPEAVVENKQPERDIIIRDHTNQTCWIIDMAVP